MRTLLEIDATITERGQTTIPSAIRRMLGVGKGDSVVFRGLQDGTIVITRKEERDSESDPTLGAFLAMLETDIRENHASNAVAEEALFAKGRELSEGVDIDIEQPLDGE